MNANKEPLPTYAYAVCSFCGDSPVNHRYEYLDSTFSIVGNTLSRLRFSRLLHAAISRYISDGIEKLLFNVLVLVRIASRSSDIERAGSLRSRMIWLEARRRGISMEQFLVAGKPSDFYRAYLHDKWHYFRSIPIPSHLLHEDYSWIDDKELLKKRLRDLGIPVPVSKTATNLKNALEFFSTMRGKTLIVKPRVGSRGRHTTTLITDNKDFVTAFRRTKQITHFVQIEEYIKGNVCRATLVQGVLRGFLEATPPLIVGDGIHTIRYLIEKQNRARPEKIGEILIKEEMHEHMRRQGYGIDDILPRDVSLRLLFRTGRLFGGRTREMLGAVHPALKANLEHAAKALGAPVLGFDLIIEHPEQDPRGQAWGIIEANCLPFIDLHDFAFEGAPAHVARFVWDLWFPSVIPDLIGDPFP